MTIYPQQLNNSTRNSFALDYDLQEEKRLIAKETEEIKKELLEKWNRRYKNAQIFPQAIESLNPLLVEFLLSFQHTLFYNEIEKKFNLNAEQRNVLPSIVWNICQNKKWEATFDLLQTNLRLSSQISSQIATLINQNILYKAKELAESPLVPKSIKNTSHINEAISLTIPEALKSYPEVGEQLITGDRIKIKNFPEPARPSLKNWLADYIMIAGREERNAVKRGNYLFQSDNGKNLSTLDRQRLSYILKCLDENIPVSISKTTKQILFSQNSENIFSANTARMAQKPLEPKNNIQSVQFSYPQKSQNNMVIIPKKDSPDPKNLVNLKD